MPQITLMARWNAASSSGCAMVYADCCKGGREGGGARGKRRLRLFRLVQGAGRRLFLGSCCSLRPNLKALPFSPSLPFSVQIDHNHTSLPLPRTGARRRREGLPSIPLCRCVSALQGGEDDERAQRGGARLSLSRVACPSLSCGRHAGKERLVEGGVRCNLSPFFAGAQTPFSSFFVGIPALSILHFLVFIKSYKQTFTR